MYRKDDKMKAKINYLFKNYFEVVAFSIGLLLLAWMNPHADGETFCLFEQAGLSFCPGEGLGHSISFIFRGELYKSLQANMLGFFAITILVTRVIHLALKNYHYNHNQQSELWPE